MSQLTITLSDELENQVRTYVREHGYDSVSDFIRDAATRAITGRPTYWERTYLAHLLEIKQKLGEDINQELLDALKGGYSWYYSFEENHTSRDELSEESMKFVCDVLDMYGDLQRSFKELDEADKSEELKEDVQFEGFDGNAGDGHLSFLHFLVEHGKFTYVEPLDKGHAINSHSQVTHVYQRMLDEYKTVKREEFGRRRALTLEEINAILYARIHPDNRKTK